MSKCWICILLLVSVAFVSGCFHKKLKEQPYVAWVQDYNNGLHKKKTVGDYVFDLQYKPADYVLLHSEEAMNMEKKETLGAMHYFTLKLSEGKEDFLKKGTASQQERMGRLYYYSYIFQNAIHLKEGTKEIPCELYHFERSYDMTPTRTFVLAFPKVENKEIEDLVLEMDCEERGLGLVKIKIDRSALEGVPELEL